MAGMEEEKLLSKCASISNWPILLTQFARLGIELENKPFTGFSLSALLLGLLRAKAVETC